jgi:hypothetical protein
MQNPVFEPFLRYALHFDDKLLTVFRRAEKIENRLAFGGYHTEVFRIAELQRFDSVSLRQERVQEIEQQVFVRLFAKQSLETEIGVWIDISSSHG